MKLFKNFILFSTLIVLVISCSTSDDSTTPDPDPVDNLINNVGVLATNSQNMPIVIQHTNGERIVSVDDNQDGVIDALVYTVGETFLVAQLDPNTSLPTSITTSANTVFLFAYKEGNTLMDIAIVKEGEQVAYIRDVPIELPTRMAGKVSGGVYEAAKAGIFAVSTAFGTVACVTAGGVLIVSTAGIAIPAAAAACGGLIVGVASFINSNSGTDNQVVTQLDNANNTYTLLQGALGCAGQNWANCASGVLTGVGLILNQVQGIWNQVGQDTIALAQGALISGFGIIKITLTWNTTSDIDLWTTDPSGEKIYYNHPQSASGGFLDFDDTDGFGPENIFWQNSAPAGSYLVQVHYYGGDGGSTNYDVQVEVQGNVSFYSGTLASEDDVDNVVTFELTTKGQQAPVFTKLNKTTQIKSSELKSK